MSISSATDRLSTPGRVQPLHLAAALLAIGLITLVVAIVISSTTSTDGRLSAGPRALDAPRSHAMTGLIGAPDLRVPSGTFRDPASQALLAAGTRAAPQAEPGLGHR